MIQEILSKLRSELTARQLEQFSTYYEMLVDWNTRVNLTAITAPEDVAKKHFVDSLAAEPYLPRGASVADVGTGAGFPGIPLLIVRPDLKLTLMDSLQKRLVFLEAVLKELDLPAECVHARAEDAGQNVNAVCSLPSSSRSCARGGRGAKPALPRAVRRGAFPRGLRAAGALRTDAAAREGRRSQYRIQRRRGGRICREPECVERAACLGEADCRFRRLRRSRAGFAEETCANAQAIPA